MLNTLLKHLSMVKLSVAVMATVLAMGCTGLIDGDNGGGGPSAEEKAAREAFVSKAKPVFDTNCASCHSGSDPAVAFLSGADAAATRTTLLASPVINLEAPQTSRILTKGAHSGPAMIASQASDVLEWLSAERDAAGVASGGVDDTLQTDPITPLICTAGNPGDPTCPITYVDISGLVAGWAGAKIKFVAQALSQDLYVTNLALEGGAEGVYIEHPLFVSRPEMGEPIPDQLDRFFNVKLNLMPSAMPTQLNGGTAAFINFAPANPISIHFKVVDKFRPAAGGTPTGALGCKSLATFKTSARAPLQTNCGSCHANAGNAAARGAMDLVGVAAADDATLQTVCNQARTRVNFQDTNASGFFIAPNPANATNHPFKFPAQANFDTFKTAVDVWVQAEKTAQ